MGHLDQYISTLKFPGLIDSVKETSAKMCGQIREKFQHKDEITGLLLGNVQSGKTGQMLGLMARMADEGYKIFLMLTTDNIDLQRQTFNRVHDSLRTFVVLSEKDEVAFSNASSKNPVAIVLKKNTRVLKKWREILLNANICRGQSLVILDDEGDAASLNTLVNRRRQSTINRHLDSIKATAHGGTIYIEVTATPQAIILQSVLSNWKPSFITYFKPGDGYLGGNFFFSTPTSYCISFTSEDELSAVLEDDDNVCPEGLQESIASFLVNCAHKRLNGESNCNFMIHPSVRIQHHNIFVKRVQEQLNLLQSSSEEEDFRLSMLDAWTNLQRTKPDLEPFEDILENIKEILEEELIFTIPLNSESFVCRDSEDPNSLKLDKGFNIVIGGNTLGRGITFPHLQTVYYCRSSRSPQADTFWQHSRIFGYDREKELVRIFIPPTLHRLFVALNESNNILIKQIESGVDDIQIIVAEGIRPTRKNVLDNTRIDILSGGVNLFPIAPVENNTSEIDPLIIKYATEDSIEVDKDMLIKLLNNAGSNNKSDFDSAKFINSINALAKKRPSTKYRLIVRINRNISRGTGTLLSESDRLLGEQYDEDVVLTMYRINGLIDNGWNGSPLWVPNIKFPAGFCFYTAE